MEYCRDFTVVIPTLNEHKAIGLVIDELLSTGIPRDNILVVDGYSNDGTVEIASSKGVRVVFQKGKGKADAIKTALEYVNTPIIVVMDGDHTYPAKYICNLVEAIYKGYDLAIGIRKYMEKGAQSLGYRIGNKILTTFFNILFGTKLSDVLSGMYAIRTDILKEIFFESKGFGIESEIAAHIASGGGSIAEIPIVYRKRVGDKKLRKIHGIDIALTMLRLSWRYNPVFFILILGSLITIPGLVLGSYVAYHYFFTGIKYYVKGMIAIFMVLVGLQLFVAAILSLYIKRAELRILRAIKSQRS